MSAAQVTLLAGWSRRREPLLAQYLVSCPTCGNAAAVHVDERRQGPAALVRFVCVESCQADPRLVLAQLPAAADHLAQELTARPA